MSDRWPVGVQGDVEDAVMAWLDKDDLANAEGTMFDAIVEAMRKVGIEVSPPRDEIELKGWKVYVTDGPLGKRMGCVTDERPLHRMTFDFGLDEAAEIARDLVR